ncbi:MAG: hypothetical protein Q9180_005617, partial [Flavoplaca navasiana]
NPEIGELSKILCAPFGGLGREASSAGANFISTFTNSLPSTPSIVGTATAPPAANASGLSVYPQCSQSCANQAAAAGLCPDGTVECACGPEFRAFTQACNVRQCNRDELQASNDLAVQLCGPLYEANSALSGSVQSTLATATASVASSLSSSVSTSIAAAPTGVQDVPASPNGTVTAPGGAPAPSAFTGAVGRLGGDSLALIASVLVGTIGVVVMVRL